MAVDYAARARALVGTRFRAQGRSSDFGLDCVGLVLAVYAIGHDAVRRDYRLRGDHRAEIEGGMARFFRRIPSSRRRAGDVLLLAVRPDQLHLAVSTHDGFVHSDARIRRVIETPGEPGWPILATYRRRARPLKDK
jgi:cell wall-associated NlpC family hydrolase